MVPPKRTKLRRLSACRSDLLDNGIDVDRPGRRGLRGLVRRHLEYFQAMLGYDARPGEVVALLADHNRDAAAAALPRRRRRRQPGRPGPPS